MRFLEIIGFIQFTFFLWLSVTVALHYIKMPVEERMLKHQSLAFLLSYNVLVGATILTLHRGVYPTVDLWTFLVLSAYLLGNYSLVTMVWRYRKHKQQWKH